MKIDEAVRSMQPKRHQKRSYTRKLVLAASLAAAAGFAAGILFAPQSGRKTREAIAAEIENIRGRKNFRLWKFNIERID